MRWRLSRPTDARRSQSIAVPAPVRRAREWRAARAGAARPRPGGASRRAQQRSGTDSSGGPRPCAAPQRLRVHRLRWFRGWLHGERGAGTAAREERAWRVARPSVGCRIPFDITECQWIKEGAVLRVYAGLIRHVNSISCGLAAALAARVRGERFRGVRRGETDLYPKVLVILTSVRHGVVLTRRFVDKLGLNGQSQHKCFLHAIYARFFALIRRGGSGQSNVPSTTVTAEPPIHVLPAASS